MSDSKYTKCVPKLMITPKGDPQHVIYGLFRIGDTFVFFAKSFTVSFNIQTPESYIADYLFWRCSGQDGMPLSVVTTFEMSIPEFVYSEDESEHTPKTTTKKTTKEECKETLIEIIKFIKYCTTFEVTDDYAKRIDPKLTSVSSS